MDWDLFFFVFCLIIFAGISYLIMRLCRRWTKNSKYKHFLNFLILIVSFSLILLIAFAILIVNVSLER